MKYLLFGLLALALPAMAETEIRLMTLKFGTVAWEVQTITSLGLDRKEGIHLVVQDAAGHAAARVAFMGGRTDVIVEDWLWVARQRSKGRDYVFIPYSSAVGHILIPAGSPATSLADLRGGKIGIAGGPLDKNWLILRAYAQKFLGMDLKAETEQVYGAPPLIHRSALAGRIDAVINFWHYSARAEAAGMKPLLSVRQAATRLGLDPLSPLLGYVVKGSFLRSHEKAVAGLIRASRAAKELLAVEDSQWEALRPVMRAKNETEFILLRQGFRAGMPGPVNEESVANMLGLMHRFADPDIIGVRTLPEGVFYRE